MVARRIINAEQYSYTDLQFVKPLKITPLNYRNKPSVYSPAPQSPQKLKFKQNNKHKRIAVTVNCLKQRLKSGVVGMVF